MISDYLTPKLKARFSDRSMKLAKAGEGPVAVFPAIHPDVGDVEIFDDGDEITVVLGRFTHTHFANYEEDLTEARREERIAEEVEEFLADLFVDRIELYGSHLGGGGWRLVEDGPRGWVSKIIFGSETYVWSGPTGRKLE